MHGSTTNRESKCSNPFILKLLLPKLQQNWTDVLLQHLDVINRPSDEHVLLVGGEQIHRNYISSLLHYHQIQNAELTLVVAQVPVAQASQYHVVELDEHRQVIDIQHQPPTPAEIPNKPGFAMVLTENYLFQRPCCSKVCLIMPRSWMVSMI